MSVAGLKKQFYKASQVSGGHSGIESRDPGFPELGAGLGPALAREGAGDTEDTCPLQGGESSGGPRAWCEVAQALPDMWAPVFSKRVGRPLARGESHPEVGPGRGPLLPFL